MAKLVPPLLGLNVVKVSVGGEENGKAGVGPRRSCCNNLAWNICCEFPEGSKLVTMLAGLEVERESNLMAESWDILEMVN